MKLSKYIALMQEILQKDGDLDVMVNHAEEAEFVNAREPYLQTAVKVIPSYTTLPIWRFRMYDGEPNKGEKQVIIID